MFWRCHHPPVVLHITIIFSSFSSQPIKKHTNQTSKKGEGMISCSTIHSYVPWPQSAPNIASTVSLLDERQNNSRARCQTKGVPKKDKSCVHPRRTNIHTAVLRCTRRTKLDVASVLVASSTSLYLGMAIETIVTGSQCSHFGSHFR